jgi:hypothetical protein
MVSWSTTKRCRVSGHGFEPTGAGQSLVTLPLVVESLEILGECPQSVFNLEVEGQHNYFAAGVLVHNKHEGGCFQAGTLITLADGTTRPIERIRERDEVLAWDEQTESLVTAIVGRAFVHGYVGGGLVAINGGVRSTPEHPVWANGRWMRADELRAGDRMLDLAGASTPVASIELLSDVAEFVYNLRVEGVHTYFADGILVHNDTKGGNDFAMMCPFGGPV